MITTRPLFLFALAFKLLLPFSTEAAKEQTLIHLTGKIYDRKSNFSKVVFKFEKHVTKKASGELVAKSKYFSMDGKTALDEVVEYSPNDTLKLFQRKQKQINRDTMAKRDGEKVLFEMKEKRAKNDKHDKDDEGWEDNMITPEQLTRYIHRHFDKILAGETIKVRLIVPSRTETVGFRVFKEEDKEFQGKVRTRLRMNPTSIFIRALVDPVDLYFEKEKSRRLLMVDGRLPVKTFDREGNYHDFVGQLVLEYPDQKDKATKGKKTATAPTQKNGN